MSEIPGIRGGNAHQRRKARRVREREIDRLLHETLAERVAGQLTQNHRLRQLQRLSAKEWRRTRNAQFSMRPGEGYMALRKADELIAEFSHLAVDLEPTPVSMKDVQDWQRQPVKMSTYTGPNFARSIQDWLAIEVERHPATRGVFDLEQIRSATREQAIRWCRSLGLVPPHRLFECDAQ